MENNKTPAEKRLELKEKFLIEEISIEEYTILKNDLEKEIEEIEKNKEIIISSNKEDNLIKKNILVKGMICTNCEKIIRKQVLSIEGVNEIGIDYSTGKGYVKFDPSKTDINKILDKIEERGYICHILEGYNNKLNNNNKTFFAKIKDFFMEDVEEEIKPEKDEHKQKIKEQKQISKAPEINTQKTNWFGYISLMLGFIIFGYFILKLIDKIPLPQLSPTMSYGLLFLVGLLTGFHCVAMCGGFVVSYTTKKAQEGKSSYTSHLAYGTGKVISYTLIGATFGLIGSIITFTPLMRGMAGIISGLFLIIFGLNMLNILPILKKIRLTTPKFISKYVGNKEKESTPFVIGLLNGLMIACGPLQAIYIMAAGTGGVIEGAKLLFIFALGTLPVMLGFGYITTIISSKMANKILRLSGIIVIILGLIMLNRGLVLTGIGYDLNSLIPSFSNNNAQIEPINTIINKEGYQEIKMDVLASGWNPNKFILKKGVPVKWVINGKELTGCNNAIQVPKLGLKFDIKSGLQTIEFTPNEEGTIPFSCWMGMIRGSFIVKSDIDLTNQDAVKKELDAVQVPKGGSCGGGGGGCGCGG